MKSRIKTLLGIEDSKQDAVLEILIENVTSHLESLLGDDVPQHLNYIVEEITVRRFNRIGSEGMRTEQVEGHRIEFYALDKEFDPYLTIIENEKSKDGITRRG